MPQKVGAPIWVPPSAAAKIGGETLPPLILNAIGTRYFIDARLDGSIQDGTIESTTKGAPTLTLQVVDPDGELLGSDLFARRIDLVLDNVPFRLVQVSRQEDDMLELQFEHRLCSWLREHTKARKASRGTKTRAEFAYSLVLEVKKEPVVFVSPDMHKRQPRAAKIDRATKDANKAPGFLDNPTNLPFTRSQLKNADRVLSVAAQKHASPKATLALAEACIVEAPNFANPASGDASSVGILQLLDIHYGGSVPARRDIERVASDFLEKGFSGKGGAMALAKANPTKSAGWVAQQVQGSAFPLRYDQVHDKAQQVVDAWRGASGTEGGLSADTTGYPKYEFKRGDVSPGDAKEDSWVALQRLADEVRWRCFIDGRNVLYFVSDEQLMRSRPLYLVTPNTEGVRSVTFDVEVGKRTVVYKGRRQHKPSEATLAVRMGRWAAPPGAVVEIAGYGLADGRWLVDSMTRGIFDSEAQVQLRQPQKALREPAASRTSGGTGSSAASSDGGPAASTSSGSEDTVTRVYVAAKSISAQNLPYVWGGGHAKVGVPDGGTGRDKGIGYDCSGSVAAALDAAGILPGHRVMVSGGFASSWGDPGEGKSMTVWANAQHVWIEFKGRSAKRFDTSPRRSGPRGPQLRFTARPDGRSEGFTPRHWKGT